MSYDNMFLSKKDIEDRIRYSTERIVNLLDEIDRLKKKRLELIEDYNKRIDSEQLELKKKH